MNKKIFTLVVIFSLVFTNYSYANDFPKEPMVIYWSISWINSVYQLKIYDGNSNILATVPVNSLKYWTNDAFNISSKVTLNEYVWQLNFEVYSWDKIYDVENIVLWEILSCNNDLLFQPWMLCEYNIEVWSNYKFISWTQEDAQVSSWWWWWDGGWWSTSSISTWWDGWWWGTVSSTSSWWGGGWWSSSRSRIIPSIKKVNTSNSSNTANNVTKYSKKDYLKWIKDYYSSRKKILKVWNTSVLSVEWEEDYDDFVSEVINNLEKEVISKEDKKILLKDVNLMSIYYWVYTDEETPEYIRNEFQKKFNDTKKEFSSSFNKIKNNDNLVGTNISSSKSSKSNTSNKKSSNNTANKRSTPFTIPWDNEYNDFVSWVSEKIDNEIHSESIRWKLVSQLNKATIIYSRYIDDSNTPEQKEKYQKAFMEQKEKFSIRYQKYKIKDTIIRNAKNKWN